MYDLRLGQMEPTDIRGIPFYNREGGPDGNGIMDWAQPVDLPQGEQLVIDAIEAGQFELEAEKWTK